MKLKTIIILGIGLTLASVSQSFAQAKEVLMPAVAKKEASTVVVNAPKTQIEGLLSTLQNNQIGGADLAGFAAKTTSYINEDITATEQRTDKADAGSVKILDNKKALLKKAETLSAKYSSGKETKKDALVELIQQYIKTF